MKNRERTHSVSFKNEKSDLKLALMRLRDAYPAGEYRKLLEGDTAKGVRVSDSDYEADLIIYLEQDGEYIPSNLIGQDEDVEDYTKIVGHRIKGYGGIFGWLYRVWKFISSKGKFRFYFDPEESAEILDYAKEIRVAREKYRKEREKAKAEETTIKPTTTVKEIDVATWPAFQKLLGYMAQVPTDELYQAMLQEIADMTPEEREDYLATKSAWADEMARESQKEFQRNVYTEFLKVPEKLAVAIKDLEEKKKEETGEDIDVTLGVDDIVMSEAKRLFDELKFDIDPAVAWDKCMEAARSVDSHSRVAGIGLEMAHQTMVDKLLMNDRISRRTEADRLVEKQEKMNRTLKDPDKTATGANFKKYLLACYKHYHGSTKDTQKFEEFIAVLKDDAVYSMKSVTDYLDGCNLQPHLFMSQDYDVPTRL